jgi:hypothetical protein
VGGAKNGMLEPGEWCDDNIAGVANCDANCAVVVNKACWGGGHPA